MVKNGVEPSGGAKETYELKTTNTSDEVKSKSIAENSTKVKSLLEGTTADVSGACEGLPLISEGEMLKIDTVASVDKFNLSKAEKGLVVETPSDENSDFECGSCPKRKIKKLPNSETCDKFSLLAGVCIVGLICGSIITLAVNKSDTTTTNQDDHFEKPTKLKNLTAKERFDNKMDEFKSVGCKPRPIKMYTKSLLDPTDETIDLRIYPLFQYVNQCMPIMNYCPGTMECLPTEDGKKRYKLHFKIPSHYEEKYAVNVMEHIVCKCQRTRLSEP